MACAPVAVLLLAPLDQSETCEVLSSPASSANDPEQNMAVKVYNYPWS